MSVGAVETPTEINGVPVVEIGENGALGKDDFLTLLTTQLQYQDPLNPMSNEDMIAQTATFSQLEAQLALNDNFTNFLDQQTTLFDGIGTMFSTMLGTNFLGSQMEFRTNKVVVDGEKVSPISVDLPEPTLVGYTVVNETGSVVDSVDSELYQAGQHQLPFDGNDRFGQKLPDGVYQLNIAFFDEDGNPIDGSSFSKQKVTSVDFRSGTPVMTVESGDTVALSDMLAVSEEVV